MSKSAPAPIYFTKWLNGESVQIGHPSPTLNNLDPEVLRQAFNAGWFAHSIYRAAHFPQK